MQQQSDMFPQQPECIERILIDLKRNEENLELIKKSYEVSKLALWHVSRSLKGQLQEHCIHPETRKEPYEYRRGVDYILTVCTVCNKELSRV